MSGCGTKSTVQQTSAPSSEEKILSPLGFTIQAGAFSKVDNALLMVRKLTQDGLDPFYFFDGRFYKIRFGNFTSFENAKETALNLVSRKLIEDYYILRPESYVYVKHKGTENLIRKIIVETAEKFLGIPYKWGEESAKDGFDCSGLTMVVYRVNGIDLPRNSRLQFKRGKDVSRDSIKAGDLVFFKTGKSNQVSHVGIYQGDDKFIHAPKKGKKIKVASLTNTYFQKRFAGARTFL